ncbi:MAG: hypothetical protein KAS72_05210 [Phycisphaerales bacterium]|nr:hypothetical protein [Phycisphaerales bacterium]
MKRMRWLPLVLGFAACSSAWAEMPSASWEFTTYEAQYYWEGDADAMKSEIGEGDFFVVMIVDTGWPPQHIWGLYSVGEASWDDSITIEQTGYTETTGLRAEMRRDGAILGADLDSDYRIGNEIRLLFGRSGDTLHLYTLNARHASGAPGLEHATATGVGAFDYSTVADTMEVQIGRDRDSVTTTNNRAHYGPTLLVTGAFPATDDEIVEMLLNVDRIETWYGPAGSKAPDALSHAWGEIDVDNDGTPDHPRVRTPIGMTVGIARLRDVVGDVDLTLSMDAAPDEDAVMLYPSFHPPAQQSVQLMIHAGPQVLKTPTGFAAGFMTAKQGYTKFDSRCAKRPHLQVFDDTGNPAAWSVPMPHTTPYYDASEGGLRWDWEHGIIAPNPDFHATPVLAEIGDDCYFFQSYKSDTREEPDVGDYTVLAFSAWKAAPNWSHTAFTGPKPTWFDNGHCDFQPDEPTINRHNASTTYLEVCPVPSADAVVGACRQYNSLRGFLGAFKLDSTMQFQTISVQRERPPDTYSGHPLKCIEFVPGKVLVLYDVRPMASVAYHWVAGVVLNDVENFADWTNAITGEPLTLPIARDATEGPEDVRIAREYYESPEGIIASVLADGQGRVWILEGVDLDGGYRNLSYGDPETDPNAQWWNKVAKYRMILLTWDGTKFDEQVWEFPPHWGDINSLRRPVLQWADAERTAMYAIVSQVDGEPRPDLYDGQAPWAIYNDAPTCAFFGEAYGTGVHIWLCRTPYTEPDKWVLLQQDFITLSQLGGKSRGICVREWDLAMHTHPYAMVQIVHESFLIDRVDGTQFAMLPLPPLPPECPGDLDGDLIVGQSDLGILLAAYELSGVGDIDGDGDTDQSDLGILLANYNQPCGP